MSAQPDRHSSFSPARRWVIGFNVLVSCVVLLAVMAMINYVASRHYRRFQWSADPRYQLSPLTLQMLETLTNEVKVVVFFDPEENPLYSSVKGLIDEYQLRSSKLRVEYIDYVRSPDRAAPLKAQYKLGSDRDKDLVIFESAGRPPRIVYDKELSDYDVSESLARGEIRRTTFKGEQFFTSAIVSVTESSPFKACFLQGHGEHDPASEDDLTGYQKFSRLLGEKYINVEPLSLLTNEVPADCQLLIIAGPRTRFPPFELEKVQDYLKRGGRAFILLVNPLLPDVKQSGLEKVLETWGVEVGNNLVTDPPQTRADSTGVLMTREFGQHAIVEPLKGSRLALINPHSVRQQPGERRTGETTKIAELVFTGKEGLARNPAGAIEHTGAIPLAVAVERGAIQGVSPDRGSTRIVVTGDSYFLSNVPIELEANHDFANLAVNWLLGRSQLLAIGPRPVHEYQISLTETQMRNARLVLLGGLPGAVLLLGLLVWLRRRR